MISAKTFYQPYRDQVKARINCRQYMEQKTSEPIGHPMPCPVPGHMNSSNGPGTSFNLFKDDTLFRCFGNHHAHGKHDWSGDVIELCREWEGFEHEIQAVRFLGGLVGIKVPYYDEKTGTAKGVAIPIAPMPKPTIEQVQFPKEELRKSFNKYLRRTLQYKRDHKDMFEAVTREQLYFCNWFHNIPGQEHYQAEIKQLHTLMRSMDDGTYLPTLSPHYFAVPRASVETSSTYYHEFLKDRDIDIPTATKWNLGNGHGNSKGEVAYYRCRNNATCSECQQGEYHSRHWLDNRLIFPVCDAFGKVVYDCGRMQQAEFEEARKKAEQGLCKRPCKYRVVKDADKGIHWYGLDHAIQSINSSNFAVCVEGYVDVIRCHQIGVTQAVSCTTSSISTHQAAILKGQCDYVFILLDDDNSGKGGTAQGIKKLIEVGFKATNIYNIAECLDGAKDPDELIQLHGKLGAKVMLQDAIRATGADLDIPEHENDRQWRIGLHRVEVDVLPTEAEVAQMMSTLII